MYENNVRLVRIELCDYKNVAHGILEMPCAASRDFSCDRAEILGIYGQNGSGKTAVIEALSLAKDLLSASPLPHGTADGIAQTAKASSCALSFFIGDENEGILAEYAFTVSRSEASARGVCVSEEKIAYRTVSTGKASPQKTLLHYKAEEKSRFLTPKYRYAAMAKNEEDAVELAVAKKLSLRNAASFIFSEDVRPFLLRGLTDSPDDLTLKRIVQTLSHYARQGFFVVDSNHSGTISIGAVMPLALHFDGDEETPEQTLLSLTEPSVQTVSTYEFIKKSVSAINHVLGVLIPGMSLFIKEYGGQTTEDGREGMRFEILSVRGDTKIPLKCESEGIKKLISVLSILIAMYNHPSVLVAVDEFDAGVYEYLLGEILGILEENGRGQLLFTSHNLRPLEMIDRRDIIFTTTNPDNRYIRLSGSKGNLRDQYIRSIHVGGQKEELYGYSNPLEIARAFRLAGKEAGDRKERK
ncbi:MAG: ATP-binding protein [Clostridia bacterium]|nr:ATP-binding protein [Clostridia bacterium]